VNDAVRKLADDLRRALAAYEMTAPRPCPSGCFCPLSKAVREARALIVAVDAYDSGELVPGGLPT
jgi:hypothetical protein